VTGLVGSGVEDGDGTDLTGANPWGMEAGMGMFVEHPGE